MTEAPRMVQLSGAVVDLTYRVAEIPAPGTEAIVTGFSIAAGGGFNAMAAAQRMGLATAYGGTPGTGPFAEVVRAALAAEGIVTLRDPVAQDHGICTVLVLPSGERSFVHAHGADGTLTDADMAGLPLRPEDWLLLSGYTLSYPDSRDAMTRWLAGPGRGRRLVFDPSPLVGELAPAALRAALDAALWVSANGAEALAITGIADPARAAAALARDRAGGALVRIGADGAWLAEPGQAARLIPGHPARVRDTNGAGDAHLGAFIAMLAAGHPPAEAVRIANAAAALSTETEGPATAPPLATVLRVLGEPPGAGPTQQRRNR